MKRITYFEAWPEVRGWWLRHIKVFDVHAHNGVVLDLETTLSCHFRALLFALPSTNLEGGPF